MVTREYAGIAEAGGVKNVSCSLSESLASLRNEVTVFIPMYACTDTSSLSGVEDLPGECILVQACGGEHRVDFAHGFLNGIEIVFVKHPCFLEKRGVYTYTKADEELDAGNVHGSGHRDALFMNTVFQKAVVLYGYKRMSRQGGPDVIHCQDAATALVPVFVDFEKQNSKAAYGFYEKTKCIVTIHNAGPGYHHEFYSIGDATFNTGLPESILKNGLNGGNVEPFLLAEKSSCITTVSPQYADEIMDERTDTAGLSHVFRERGTRIVGITNGIDISRYTPSDKSVSLLPYSFDPEKGDLAGKYLCRRELLQKYADESVPADMLRSSGIESYGFIDGDCSDDITYIAYHGRVVWQKGITVLARAADYILSKNLPARFIFIGQGQPDLEKELLQVALKHEGKCVYFRGYDRLLSRLCIASADLALFPSYFEPCGLEDLIAQIFGTIPVAHATGGLCKIIDEETGFLYKDNTSEDLSAILEPLIKIKAMTGADVFKKMIAHTAANVREKFSWEQVTLTRYMPLYKELTEM